MPEGKTLLISLTVKDFAKIPTEIEPRDPKLDVEIMSQKIIISSEFIKNIEIEK
jgi:hypothetical protein